MIKSFERQAISFRLKDQKHKIQNKVKTLSTKSTGLHKGSVPERIRDAAINKRRRPVSGMSITIT